MMVSRKWDSLAVAPSTPWIRQYFKDPPKQYAAFISYSHSADGAFAPELQRGLQWLAKPWNQRRALEVFRDQTGLAVSPALWPSICAALDGSRWFALLASPEAARSDW